MIIEELVKEEYCSDLKAKGIQLHDKHESPNKEYKLELFYAGEFLRGDTHYYCQIIEKRDNKVIWEYKKGDKIRQISDYPWSPDSKQSISY